MSLCKVIDIDNSKCTNCHVCISVCPVKYCLNDHKTVSVNDDLCIGCGRCYNACPHGAINLVDDFHNFIDSINRGEKSIMILSPAVKLAFKNDYKQLITWLKEQWVLSGVFDEGLGAELCNILNMKYMKKLGTIPLLTQYCPTVIEYIKIHHPELIDYLAPIQSPTIILAKILRTIYNFNDNIAYLGPCISKRREFNDPDTENIIQYNLTIENLIKYIQIHNVDLKDYKESYFDLAIPERGSVFCKPGGMINIVNRYYENPRLQHVEGKSIYKKYLKDLSKDIEENYKVLPIMLDILNCEGGCFRGPAMRSDLTYNEELWYINEIENESIIYYNNKNKANKEFFSLLNDNKIDLNRSYFSDSSKPIYTLENKELSDMYKELNKSKPTDYLNCRSCGFTTCQEFATSLYYNQNSPENCRVFINNKLMNTINDNSSIAEEIAMTTDQMEATSQSIIQITEKTKESFEEIYKNTGIIKDININLKNNADHFGQIILAISEVSEQINLLSLNASIEASRTGESGKGFSVVAQNIRDLADKTKKETDKIHPIMNLILNDVNSINDNMDSLTDETSEFTEAIETLHSSIVEVNKSITELAKSADKLNSFRSIF